MVIAIMRTELPIRVQIKFINALYIIIALLVDIARNKWLPFLTQDNDDVYNQV